MRRNARITHLENEVARLSRLIDQLMDTVTTPEIKTQPVVPAGDWRSKPRKRIKTANSGHDWTAEELQFVATAYKKGINRKEIARVLGRTERAVSSAVSRHGLLG